VLGVSQVVFLGYEDGVLQNTIGLRRDIVRQIRRFRPQAIICQDPTSRWLGQRYINHPDHRAAGDACLDAVYPSARDPHVFSDLAAEGLHPHKVQEVYVGSWTNADVWVDITSTIERKLAALMQHVSQVSGDASEVETWVRDRARRAAEQARASGQSEDGMEYAEAFKYFKLD
jgi:LmbE family N-acetylglucosaminyl deacetylase